MKLYRKCQLPEIKSDKNFINGFYEVTGATNFYTVSVCLEYLRSRWNRIFKNALTTTSTDWSITQNELEGIAYPKTTSRHLERTINKFLFNCNVEPTENAYQIWRAETPLCTCRVDTEPVLHYLFFSPCTSELGPVCRIPVCRVLRTFLDAPVCRIFSTN